MMNLKIDFMYPNEFGHFWIRDLFSGISVLVLDGRTGYKLTWYPPFVVVIWILLKCLKYHFSVIKVKSSFRISSLLGWVTITTLSSPLYNCYCWEVLFSKKESLLNFKKSVQSIRALAFLQENRKAPRKETEAFNEGNFILPYFWHWYEVLSSSSFYDSRLKWLLVVKIMNQL